MDKTLLMYMTWIYVQWDSMRNPKNTDISLEDRKYFLSLIGKFIYDAYPELEAYNIDSDKRPIPYKEFHRKWFDRIRGNDPISYVRMLTDLNTIMDGRLKEYIDHHRTKGTRSPQIQIQL